MLYVNSLRTHTDTDRMVWQAPKHGYGKAWFRDEVDAESFATEFNQGLKEFKKILRYMKNDTLKPDVFKSIKHCFTK